MQKQKIKLFIADDHPVVREGLKAFFSSLPDYTVVGEAEDGLEVFERVSEARPDVLLIDITMPHLDGIHITKRITEQLPETKVVVLTMHYEQDYAIKAFRTGAKAYVIKGASLDEVLMAVEKVLAGKLYASPSIADELLIDFVQIVQCNKSIEPFDTLSKREKEVLELIADSATNNEIGEKLFISVHTVKSHRKNIMKKLNVNGTVGLVKVATLKGLVKSDKPPSSKHP